MTELDRPPIPEKLHFTEGLVGLQARMRLNGDALNPDNMSLAEVRPEEMDKIDNTLGYLVRASNKERARSSMNKQEWIEETVGKFQQGRDFFTKSEEGKRWAGLFEKLGINAAEFNAQQGNALYERFFGDGNTESNIARFVDEVITNYTDQNGQIDKKKLDADLDGIQWLAGIFGKGASEVTTQLIDAKVRNAQELAAAANEQAGDTTRINTPTQDEERMLEYLWEEGQKEEALESPTKVEPSAEPPNPNDRNEDKKGEVDFTEMADLPTDQILERLPTATLEAADFFCKNLRERMMQNGDRQAIYENGADLILVTDHVTKKIQTKVARMENVRDSWFLTNGFEAWANENALPLFYVIPAGIHAQAVLKLENRGGKHGYVFYDPLSGAGEQWREFAKQLTKDEYLEEQIRNGKIKVRQIPIDGEIHNQYYFPARPANAEQGNLVGVEEMILDDRDIYLQWLRAVMPHGIGLSTEALTQVMEDRFDLTLADDADYPDNVRRGKIQQFQYDGYNCALLAFYASALRAAAKPGSNEFKTRGRDQFERDFGVRFLTREEILKQAATHTEAPAIVIPPQPEIHPIPQQPEKKPTPVAPEAEKPQTQAPRELTTSSLNQLVDEIKTELSRNPSMAISVTGEAINTLLPSIIEEVSRQTGINLQLLESDVSINADSGQSMGIGRIVVEAKKMFFKTQVEVDFSLSNQEKQGLVGFSNVIVKPPQIMMFNIQEIVDASLKEKTVNQQLMETLQKVLSDGKSDITIDDVELTLQNNRLVIRIRKKI